METNKTNCFCQICKKGEIVEELKTKQLGKPDRLVIGDFPTHVLVHANYYCDRCGVLYCATETNGLKKYEKEKTIKNPA